MSGNLLIHAPLDPYQFETVEEVLLKAYGREVHVHSEVSPYRSVQDLQYSLQAQVQSRLTQVFQAIRVEWLSLSKAKQFTIGGKVYLNPVTGKALTRAEWARIKKSLLAAFQWVYRDTDVRLAKIALALGKLLSRMPLEGRITRAYEQMQRDLAYEQRIITDDPQWRNSLYFAEEYAVENITSLSQVNTKAIHDVILDSLRAKQTTRQLESRLFDRFGDFNRDWRRIVLTETATAVTNGFLMAELEKADPDERIYMKGVSSAGACAFCRERIHGQVFVLLGTPLVGDDHVTIGDKEYVAIWPNKNNVGRKYVQWWACVPAHPHCACSFVRWRPGFDKYWDQLHAAMNRAEKEARERFPEVVV